MEESEAVRAIVMAVRADQLTIPKNTAKLMATTTVCRRGESCVTSGPCPAPKSLARDAARDRAASFASLVQTRTED